MQLKRIGAQKKVGTLLVSMAGKLYKGRIQGFGEILEIQWKMIS